MDRQWDGSQWILNSTQRGHDNKNPQPSSCCSANHCTTAPPNYLKSQRQTLSVVIVVLKCWAAGDWTKTQGPSPAHNSALQDFTALHFWQGRWDWRSRCSFYIMRSSMPSLCIHNFVWQLLFTYISSFSLSHFQQHIKRPRRRKRLICFFFFHPVQFLRINHIRKKSAKK